MECTGSVQLDGLRDHALNAIWGVDEGDFVTENKLCVGDRIKLEVMKNEDNLIVVQKI